MNKSGLNVEIREVDDPSRLIKFTGVSDQSAVRDGMFLEPRGVVLDNYKKNPVFLWAHDYSQPAVGRAIAVTPNDRGVEFDVEFAGRDINPFAEIVYQLYRRKFQRAVSVGWITQERDRDNLPENVRVRITKWDLLELSAVPVPADPGAVMHAAIGDCDRELISRALATSEVGAAGWSPVLRRVEAMEQTVSELRSTDKIVDRIVAVEATLAELEGRFLESENPKAAAKATAALSAEQLSALCRSAIDRALARARGRLL